MTFHGPALVPPVSCRLTAAFGPKRAAVEIFATPQRLEKIMNLRKLVLPFLLATALSACSDEGQQSAGESQQKPPSPVSVVMMKKTEREAGGGWAPTRSGNKARSPMAC